jgi:putative DNA primase/helicase
VWITGETQTGKTWIQDNIITPLLGKYVLNLSSDSTAAGMRSMLGYDAKPVRHDEMEAETKKGLAELLKILEMVRYSSSNKDSLIVKGTASGGFRTYCIRSMFIFSSINPKLVNNADETRISLLKLIRRKDYSEGAIFTKLQTMVFNTLTPEFCLHFQGRSIKMIPIIRENIKTFRKIMSLELASNRLGDQIGSLLAGAWTCHSDDVISKADAEKFVTGIDWRSETSVINTTDQEKLLYIICEAMIKHGQGTDYESVGTLIKDGLWDEPNLVISHNGYEKRLKKRKDAINELRKYGISIVRDLKNGDKNIVFAQNHSKLNGLLQGSPWSGGYRHVLSRITGSKHSTACFGGGINYRCISIPSDSVFDELVYEDEEEEF